MPLGPINSSVNSNATGGGSSGGQEGGASEGGGGGGTSPLPGLGTGTGAAGGGALGAGGGAGALGGPGGVASLDQVTSDAQFQSLEALFDLSSLQDGYPTYPMYEDADKIEEVPKTVSDERPEPIASFNLSRNSIEGGKDSLLYSSCIQALIEDRISLEYANSLVAKIKLDDPDFFKEMSNELQKEIDNAQKSIDQLTNIFDMLVVSDQSLNPTFPGVRTTISNIATNMYDKLSIDPDSLLSKDTIPDPANLLYALAGQDYEKEIETKTRTALICQLLGVIHQSLSSCMTNLSINKPIFGGGGETTPRIYSGANNLTVLKPPMLADVKTLGSNSTLNLVYGIADYSYPSMKFYEKMANFSLEEQVMGLTSMISNEMALSAGLGRLVNTPLGNKFGAEAKDFTKLFLGVKNLPHADLETLVPDSLADYLVVSSDDGKTTAQARDNDSSNAVLLLDGTFAGKTKRSTNSFDAFMKSVARAPDNNKIDRFVLGMNNCTTAFDEGIEFYKKVHLRDKKPKLLTPRGLFSRLLLDISESMDMLSGAKTQIDENMAAELAVLKTICDLDSTGWMSPGSTVKHFMVGIIVRKAAALLTGKDYTVPKSPPADATTTNVKIITKGTNSKVDEFTVISSQEDPPPEYIPTDETPQFTPSPTYEGHLLNPGWMLNFRRNTFYRFAVLGNSSTYSADTPGYTTFNIDLAEFIQELSALEGTIIDKIAKLFVEMVTEAELFSQSEAEDGSWLNELRLSRNSGLSGTLLITGLFEAALSLVGLTLDGGLIPVNVQPWAINEAEKKGGTMIDIAGGDSVMKLDFSLAAGKASTNALRSKALRLLSQASDADSFEALTDKENIPDLSYGSENVPGSDTIITNSGISINSFVNYFYRLAQERDMPLQCFFSVKSVIDQTNQSTENIKSLGRMLRGDLEPNPLALALRNFSIKDKAKTYGFRYLDSASDYSLQIAQDRLNRIQLSLTKPIGRLEKIRSGETACIKIMLDNILANGSYPNYLFYVLGLPSDFVSTEILPSFSLSVGREAQGVNTAYMTSIITKTETFGNEMFDDVYRHCFGNLKISSKSFDIFETTTPTTEDDILDLVMLRDEISGKEFMKKNDLPASLYPKNVLRSEVYSYLIKKLFSTISTADLNEHNLVNYDYEKRSTGSKTLARAFAKSANLNENEFDDVFEDQGQSTFVRWQNLLKKTAYPFEGGNIVNPTVTHAQAELFYDIFGSIYFMKGLIHEKVFAPSIFDKTFATVISSGEFQNITSNNTGLQAEADVGELDNAVVSNVTSQNTGYVEGIAFDEFEVNVVRSGKTDMNDPDSGSGAPDANASNEGAK